LITPLKRGDNEILLFAQVRRANLEVVSLLFLMLCFSSIGHCAEAQLKDLSISGGVQDGKARLVIEGFLDGTSGEKTNFLFATALQHSIHVSRDKQTHTIAATFEVLQGEPREFILAISGEGEIKKVTGDALQDWSVREETNGTRALVLRPRKSDKPLTQFSVTIGAEREMVSWSNPTKTFALSPPHAALLHGYITV
jgi:hypothetical protein